LLGSIKQALGAELTTRAWLDGPTRDAAQAKLDKVRDKVGAPDAWPAPPTIFLSGGDYQWQVLEVSRWKAQRNLASLAEPIDRDAWSTPPCVTTAFYSPGKNEMVFPAAILQTPQFAVGRPDAINYGTIGSIMGHELTHGFDDYGRQFDGDGKLANWWTPEAASAFVSRATCLADQYSTYEPLPGIGIDGQATLGENIADLGGLRLAYAAYKARGSKDPFSGSYTGDQQFFLAYAQMQCANFRDELVRSSIRSDEHSPPKFRVNGVVANLPEFAAAFACPAGSAMGPVDRCEVW
jgi:predicted metalloendopeptidase